MANSANSQPIIIGSATIWRGVYSGVNKYYAQNLVTMCACLFQCKADVVTDVPPLVTIDETYGIMAFANTDTWVCIIDNLILYNEMRSAVNALEAEQERKQAELERKQAELLREAMFMEMMEHPMIEGDNHNWWRWDINTHGYIDTGMLSRGHPLWPSFYVDKTNLHLMIEDTSDCSKISFKLKKGRLIINTKDYDNRCG